MGPKTELLLYQLLWMTEQITQPTMRNLDSSFEGWAYHSGLLRHVQRLEADALLETRGQSLARIVRLTEKGRRLVKGQRDPEQCWAAEWDGVWRIAMFDVPENRNKVRVDLRRRLKEMHFGWLQKSVWVSPHTMDPLVAMLERTQWEPGSLTLMESRVVGGTKGKDLAACAWDFDQINEGYNEYLAFLNRWRKESPAKPSDEQIAEEKRRWDGALGRDPLLPGCLLPKGYRGKKALRHRRESLPGLCVPSK